MHTNLSDRFKIRYPIFGFSPSPLVVAAISRAGGMGVLGAASMTPEGLSAALNQIEASIDGGAYGVDVIMPVTTVESPAADAEKLIDQLREQIPERHRKFVEDLLARFAVPALPNDAVGDAPGAMFTHLMARAQLDIAFDYSPSLVVNALGPLPADVVQRARARGIATAALAGKPEHALRHRDAGADVIISTGYEAAGHTGEVAGMVLHAEIVDAVAPLPVMASGAMATGRQIAAAIALGAEGAWCGSVWLTTEEAAEPGSLMFGGSPDVRRDYLAASSSDTVRTRWATGKPARLLRTAWSDAWEADDSPGTLPMPLQALLVEEAQMRIAYAGRNDVGFKPAGQVIGMLKSVKSVAETIQDMVDEYDITIARLAATQRLPTTAA